MDLNYLVCRRKKQKKTCVFNDLVSMLINNAKCKFVQKKPQKHCTFKLVLKKNDTSTISLKLVCWQMIQISLYSNYTYNKKLKLHEHWLDII